MAIDMVKIRGRITIGSLTVQTPYILSFNVNITRGNVSTFSASLKIPYQDVRGNITGDSIVIRAGENSASHTIFSGVVKKATISPVFDDPSFVLLNISGDDILSKLAGKKYTRRCRSTNTSWVTLDSIVRKGLRSGKFRTKKSDYIDVVSTEILEQSEETTTNTGPGFNQGAKNTKKGDPEKVDGRITIFSEAQGQA